MMTAEQELDRYREAARWLLTCLYGAADKGGWTRLEIFRLAEYAAEKWPELRAGKEGA